MSKNRLNLRNFVYIYMQCNTKLHSFWRNFFFQNSSRLFIKLKLIFPHSFEVIIVGSGLAGLSAAAHLVENGVKEICVLEAKNSLGGRIRTIGVNGSPLELGAQYIHGACSANSVFNLANK